MDVSGAPPTRLIGWTQFKVMQTLKRRCAPNFGRTYIYHLSSNRDVTGSSTRSEFRSSASLRDGTPVCVRAIRPDDKERFKAGFRRLSPQTIHRRFFHARAALTPQDLRYFTELDFTNHVGLGITIGQEPGETLIAVGRFIRLSSAPDQAEVAFVVADEYQHRGAATLLLQHLVGMARGLEIRKLVAIVQDDNRGMLQVLEHAGFPLERAIENGVTHISLDIARRI